MDVRCNQSPSFGKLKGNILLEQTPEIKAAQEALAHCKHWHVVSDGNGYKLEYKDTSKTYEIADKPKRHSTSTLFIRTFDKAHKVKGKVTSFRVDLNSHEEALALYKRIMSAAGLEKMVIIAKALEEQVIKRNHDKKIKKLFA